MSDSSVEVALMSPIRHRSEQGIQRGRWRCPPPARPISVWKILHQGVSYIEQGQETNPPAKKRRAQKLVKALRNLENAVTLAEINAGPGTAATE